MDFKSLEVVQSFYQKTVPVQVHPVVGNPIPSHSARNPFSIPIFGGFRSESPACSTLESQSDRGLHKQFLFSFVSEKGVFCVRILTQQCRSLQQCRVQAAITVTVCQWKFTGKALISAPNVRVIKVRLVFSSGWGFKLWAGIKIQAHG